MDAERDVFNSTVKAMHVEWGSGEMLVEKKSRGISHLLGRVAKSGL